MRPYVAKSNFETYKSYDHMQKIVPIYGVPCVELIDTNSSGGDRNIGHELVKQGLAMWMEGEVEADYDAASVTRES